jgi:hypothetical protein
MYFRDPLMAEGAGLAAGITQGLVTSIAAGLATGSGAGIATGFAKCFAPCVPQGLAAGVFEGLPFSLPIRLAVGRPFAGIDPLKWLSWLLALSGLSDAVKGLDRFFNSGGPMTRTRKEPVNRSLLDNGQMQINWPCRMVVGLKFPQGVSPVTCVEALLEKSGYESPGEAVTAHRELPIGIHYCHPVDLSPSKLISPDSHAEFLRFALILGLCGPTYYDPNRPVIWTEGRLTRTVGLYLPRGFYED